jgi:hypothetical protein
MRVPLSHIAKPTSGEQPHSTAAYCCGVTTR